MEYRDIVEIIYFGLRSVEISGGDFVVPEKSCQRWYGSGARGDSNLEPLSWTRSWSMFSTCHHLPKNTPPSRLSSLIA